MSYVHPEYLVDTEWLAAHLNDPDVRIIESDEDALLYPMATSLAQYKWIGSAPYSIRCAAIFSPRRSLKKWSPTLASPTIQPLCSMEISPTGSPATPCGYSNIMDTRT